MKNLVHFIFIGLYILVATIFFVELSGCKKKNLAEGAKLIINYDLMKTTITVNFVDAKTHELIGKQGGKSVKITVGGADKDAVVDITGVKNEFYKSVNGFMSLALNPNAPFVPSVDNPIRVSLIAKTDGYITTGKSLLITKEGNYQIQIAMIDLGNLPDGVEKVWKTGMGNIVDDTLQGDVNITTPATNVKFTIPSGTIILDAGGNALQSPLTVSIIYFSNRSNEALAAFPGGLFVSIDNNGVIQDGTFFSAGFTTIEVYGANGRKAKTFINKKPRIEMLVNANTYNPETQSTIANGDLLPLYSYEPDSGTWSYEGVDTIISNGTSRTFAKTNGFSVSAEITHLSYFNFDWFWLASCNNGGQLVFHFDTLNTCNGSYLTGIIKKQVDSSYLTWIGVNAYYGDTVNLMYAPSGIPVFIDWHSSSCNNAVVAPQANPLLIDDLCANSIHSIPLVPEGRYISTTTIDVSAYCSSNSNIVIRPSFGIWYRRVNDFCWNWADMFNGYSRVCGLQIGTEYVFAIYYEGNWETWNATINQSFYIVHRFQLPSSVCNNVFGM